jgi:ankyrin repeat protein
MEAIRDGNWEKVIALAREHPRMAKSWARLKLTAEREAVLVLPLHLAVFLADGREETLTAIETVIEAYPNALGCKESSLKRTSLHLACLHEFPSEHLIAMLLNKHPEAALEYDYLKRLPLHYACANPQNAAIIQLLINSSPEAAELRDGQGWLPLHVACHYEADFAVIQLLLQANPDAVIALTPLDQELPLDLVKKQAHFKDRHEIMDLLKAKEKYYVPVRRPFMDSFVADNLIHPIY